MKRAIVAIAVVAAALGGDAYGKTIYVDTNAAGANNGTCWADAYEFLQDALTDADSSEKPVEIRVAQGIYQPDRNAAEPNGTGDRMATFRLINGVTIQGGYAGLGQADPNARDIAAYQTVLSGDLDSNDLDVNDLADLRDEPSRGENAYHIVTGDTRTGSAVLDGLTITGGNANGNWPDPWPYEECGGGMYNKGFPAGTKRGEGGDTIEYAAAISNCRFVANSATIGGGMYNYRCNPKISNCFFLENSAPFRCGGDVCQGGEGGGMYNEHSSPMITNCTFTGNFAPRGGGMFNNVSDPVTDSCTFTENSASVSDGGGIYNAWSSPTVSDSVFSRNAASGSGGGMANKSSSPLVANCIFSENSAVIAGAMSNQGGNATITDCTFTGNSCRAWGGAMANGSSDTILTSCVFAGNRAGRYGGAVENSRCQPVMANCTIVRNRAGETGAGVRCDYGSNGLLRNSILWGNYAPEGAQVAVKGGNIETANVLIEYSTVMGGKEGVYVGPNDSLDWGAGNKDSDPCFADLGYWDPNGTPEDASDDFWVMGDYHLRSEAGRWEPATQAWIIDDMTSACIDAGDPMTPVGAEPFSNGGRINMGAYGGTTEASKSYFGGPYCETIVAGDVNGDCKVNYLDFGIMAIHWLEEH